MGHDVVSIIIIVVFIIVPPLLCLVPWVIAWIVQGFPGKTINEADRETGRMSSLLLGVEGQVVIGRWLDFSGSPAIILSVPATCRRGRNILANALGAVGV